MISEEDAALLKSLKAKKKSSEGLTKEEKKQLKALKLQKGTSKDRKGPRDEPTLAGRKRGRPEASELASSAAATTRPPSSSSSSSNNSSSSGGGDGDGGCGGNKRNRDQPDGGDSDSKGRPTSALSAADLKETKTTSSKKSKKQKKRKEELQLAACKGSDGTDILPDGVAGAALASTAAALPSSGAAHTATIAGAAPLSDYPICEPTVRNLGMMGVRQLLPVQSTIFGDVYGGCHLIARARTGRDKTLAFALPIAERLLRALREDPLGQGGRGRGPRVLVMAPTRELARQVHEDFSKVAPTLSMLCIYGGSPYDAQCRTMREGLDVLVGTPGRVVGHLDRQTLKFDRLEHLVLDEIDQMLDMGFQEDMERIVGQISRSAAPRAALRVAAGSDSGDSSNGGDSSSSSSSSSSSGGTKIVQTLVFSESLPAWVDEVLCTKHLQGPGPIMRVDLVDKCSSGGAAGEKNLAELEIDQLCMQCARETKSQTLGDIIRVYGSGGQRSIVVFTQTNKEANRLVLEPVLLKLEASALHGDIPEAQRVETLAAFNDGWLRCLVVTDAAARGLDIAADGVDLVVQMEPPHKTFLSDKADSETFADRCTRAAHKGTCITLYTRQQEGLVHDLEQTGGVTFRWAQAPQVADLIQVSANEFAAGIDDDAMQTFTEVADELIEERGATAALSAALACITGYTTAESVAVRSLPAAATAIAAAVRDGSGEGQKASLMGGDAGGGIVVGATGPGDGGAGSGEPELKKKKKKKMGKKERQKAKAKALEAAGMDPAEARIAAGLKPLATLGPKVVEGNEATAGERGVAGAADGGGGVDSARGRSGAGHGGSDDGAGTNLAQLTAAIKRSMTLEALFDTYHENRASMNQIHLAACWNALGKLSRYGVMDRYWYHEHAGLDSLADHTVSMVSDPQSPMRARELATMAHGAAKSGASGPVLERVMAALANSIEQHLGSCNAQELANVAWAFAKSKQYDEQLFVALSEAAQRRLDRFNCQELTNFTWAFSTVGHADETLFSVLARAVERRLGGFNTQGLSNTAFAFAKAGHADVELFGAVARMTQQRLQHFNARDFGNVAYAFAKVGIYDAELFTALAKDAGRHMETLNAQGLATTVWSFTKAGHLDAELFAAFGRTVERRMLTGAADFCSQDIANMAWAFAKACHVSETLFKVLARSAAACLDDFNIQDLVNTTWAFAKLAQTDTAEGKRMFAAMGRSILQHRLDGLDAPNIANIAWAFDKAGQLDERLAAGLAKVAEQRVADFGSQDLAKVAWTFANAGRIDARLFAALAWAVEQRLDDFGDDEIEDLEWSMSQAEQQKVVKLLRQRRRDAAGAVAAYMAGSVDVSKCGRIIVAGGGIGGAAAAVALQSRGFEVIVLEADASFDSRKQGYGLTVQAQDAIQAMGINLAQDDAPSTSHYTFSADGHILGFFGEAFGVKSKGRREAENSGRFIHIPRQALRSRLLEALLPGTVRWNSKLKSFAHDRNGGNGSSGGSSGAGVTVTLTDGTTLRTPLLVGSDGIFSTVRRQLGLPGDRLNYVGLVVVLGIVEEAVMPVPLAERRIFETVDGTTRIYAMPFTTTSTMWQLSFPCSEATARTYMKDTATLKAEITRRCAKWHDPIPAMLSSTPLDCMSGYPVYDRELLKPEVLRPSAEERRCVTLMGDAAHPMTPFKAQGANQAMSDAVLLADALVDGVATHGPQAGFAAALPVFEREMLRRSSRVVVGSREKAIEMHSALALQPARKTQREAALGDMATAIAVLRKRGIGADSAADPRGLDAVVEAEVLGTGAKPARAGADGTARQAQPWKGTKVLFDDGNDEDEDDQAAKKQKKSKSKRRNKGGEGAEQN